MRVLFAAMVCLCVLTSPLRAQDEPHAPRHGEMAAGHAADEEPHESLGHRVPPLMVAPFVILLGCIAVLPLTAGHWWEHNRNKGIIAVALSIPVVYWLAVYGGHEGHHQLIEKLCEYLSFIVLLGSLFVISGGTYVRGSLAGSPNVNVGFLSLGALIASFVGTTGASMLLIRPMLRANAARPRKAHTVVFFIFTVSNCGGLLTPLGDPPLYLGFLSGVPFEWTFQLWREWLVVNGALLAIYYAWDRLMWIRDRQEMPAGEEPGSREALGLDGWWNILFLLGVVIVIYCGGNGIGTGGPENPWRFPVPEILMLLLAAGSFFATPKRLREMNRFSFGPINEVAILFVGIFATMIPALLLLNTHGASMPVREPWHFFWATGILSSFLDNAPTYLTFAATGCGMKGIDVSQARYLAKLLHVPGGPELLAAISCGAVFMGANTYIGNGPNFMVKAIAEESGVRMPGFFGYMAFSGAVLIPLFVIVTLLFFL